MVAIEEDTELDELVRGVEHSVMRRASLAWHPIGAYNEVDPPSEILAFRAGMKVYKHIDESFAPVWRIMPGYGFVYYFAGSRTEVKKALLELASRGKGG